MSGFELSIYPLQCSMASCSFCCLPKGLRTLPFGKPWRGHNRHPNVNWVSKVYLVGKKLNLRKLHCKSWAFYQNQLTLRLWLDAIIYSIKQLAKLLDGMWWHVHENYIPSSTWNQKHHLFLQLVKPNTNCLGPKMFSHRSSLATTTRHDIVWR